MKKVLLLALTVLLLLSACGEKKDNALKLADGTYTVEVSLEGGTGRATVLSPAKLEVKDGQAYLTLVWSSPNYDYMIVDGTRYDFITVEGGSTFRFPINQAGALAITADTVAMSTPHEIDYTLNIDAATVKAA